MLRSNSSQPIVIESDDEDMEEVFWTSKDPKNGQTRSRSYGVTVESESGPVRSTGSLDLEAREAVKVALAKLDSEVNSYTTELLLSADLIDAYLIDQIRRRSA